MNTVYIALFLFPSLLSLRAVGYPIQDLIQDIGDISVLNNCEIRLYMKVTRETDSPVMALERGQRYQEKYQFPRIGGTSIKLARATHDLDTGQNQGQLEYSCTDQCYFDWSWIDDKKNQSTKHADYFPGANTTMILRPSDPKCDTLICVAGDTTCKNAYFNPTDNYAVRACSLQADVHLTLCA